MSSIDFPVDFVVTWVNDNDLAWQSKKSKYEKMAQISSKSKNDEDADNRYRDFGLFKYWFRSVETNAEWVRRIYVVTDGQRPDFLDTENDKIILIDHKQIIEKKYLPTFDSNTIDLNLHKIPGLAEHFVYFNDDVFINQPVSKKDFFTESGNVRDTIGQSVIMPIEAYDHTLVNNTMKINQLVSKRTVIRREFSKFFSLRQGFPVLILNIFLSIFPRFTRLFDPHTAYSLRKSDMVAAVELLSDELQIAFQYKFRTLDDYSIQFIRYYQIISDHAEPRSMYFGQTANSDNPKLTKKLLFNASRTKVVNVNDVRTATDADLQESVNMFEKRFPNLSVFEKVAK